MFEPLRVAPIRVKSAFANLGSRTAMVFALLKGLLSIVDDRRGFLLLELGLRKTALIGIRFSPDRLELTVDKRSARILYYLIELRNHGVAFDGKALAVPNSDIRLRADSASIDELAVILFAFRYGVMINKYDEKHYLATVPNSEGRFIVRNNVYGDLSTLFETFIRGQYGDLDVKGKRVLDVGAAIGDSGIFFALSGAKSVNSFEPDDDLFGLCRMNIAINGLKNVVVTKAAVGSQGQLGRVETDQQPQAPTVDLDAAVQEMGGADVLKMDCEGCEFPCLLGAAPQTLTGISEMTVEYHGNPEKIAQRLEELQFEVKVYKPWTYFSGKTVGFLHAKRRASQATAPSH